MQYTKELHLQHVAAFWDGRLEVNRSTTTEPNWCPATLPPELELREFFRIKPEPKLRPWKMDEVPLDCWVRTAGENCAIFKILACQPMGIVSANSFADNNSALILRSFEFALKNIEHSTDGGKTWKPCGVEE